MSSGWLIGYALGGAVVLLVVTVLLVLILSARRIGDQAIAIRGALEESRVNTLGLWEVQDINRSIRSISSELSRARSALGGGP